MFNLTTVTTTLKGLNDKVDQKYNKLLCQSVVGDKAATAKLYGTTMGASAGICAAAGAVIGASAAATIIGGTVACALIAHKIDKDISRARLIYAGLQTEINS